MQKQISKKLKHTWHNMRSRCYNQKNDHYKTYGGRGIKIEWRSFSEFKHDMTQSLITVLSSTYETISIDRINNDGNYSKQNCRWISVRENSSIRHRGVKKTEDHIKKMSNERKGKPQTDARIAILKRIHNNQKKKIVQICIKTGTILNIFDGIIDASLHTGIVNQNINECALNKRKSAGGYHWKYYEEYKSETN